MTTKKNIPNWFLHEVIVLVLLSFIFGFVLFPIIQYYKTDVLSAVGAYKIDNCSGNNVNSFAECLSADFNSWWVYNHSNAGKKLNESTMRTEGGVCSHASKWFVNKAKENGVDGASFIIENYESSRAHEFAVLFNYNLTDYCVVDQGTVVGCSKLEKSKNV